MPAKRTTIGRRVVLVTAASLLGCNSGSVGERKSDQNASDSTSWSWIASDSVRELTLDEVGATTLESSGNLRFVSGDRLAVSQSSIYVVDEGAHAIRRYDRKGRVVYSLTVGSPALPRIISPDALVAVGDTLYVMDRNHANGITVLDGFGKILKWIDVRTTSSLSSFARADSAVIVANSGLSSELAKNEVASLVHRVDSSGAIASIGCRPDPTYSASIRRNGLYSLFRSVGVSVSEGVVYCRQSVTPVVQRFKVNGDELSPLSLVPPFYRRSADVPLSLNQRDINSFSSLWTEHLDFVVYDAGFHSVYAQFDSTRNQRRYRLFRCLKAGIAFSSCGIADMDERPMAFVEPDTLVVLSVNDGASSEVRVKWVHIR